MSENTTNETITTDEGEGEDKPKVERVRAADVQESVFDVIQKAGEEGITLKALEEVTDLRYRVLHNVVWHLGLNPKLEGEQVKVRKVGEGRTLRVAATTPKRTRKRAPRKTTAKAA